MGRYYTQAGAADGLDLFPFCNTGFLFLMQRVMLLLPEFAGCFGTEMTFLITA
jgi:hypothetical protein